jgi:hypothetical protein
MASHIGVVIHVTAGEGDPYNEFANPANQVSAHFGIGNGRGGMADGLLEQYVDTGTVAWAQAAGNLTYVSVETEGEPADALTALQLVTFANLLAWLHTEHGIPLAVTNTPGAPGLITHGAGGVAWGDHPDCPGPARSAQRSEIVALAFQILNPPIGADAMFSETVTVGTEERVIVGASGTGATLNDHLLVFVLDPAYLVDPTNGSAARPSVLDVTAGIGPQGPGGSLFTVAA